VTVSTNNQIVVLVKIFLTMKSKKTAINEKANKIIPNKKEKP
jgi:hypothetical protein